MLSVALAVVLASHSDSNLDALAHRVLGNRSSGIAFRIDPTGPADSYRVDAAQGSVHIVASTKSAAARGLYDYLKQGRPGEPGSIVNWDGERLNVGKRWWDAHLTGASPAKYRHYFNVCTFGYTTAFWNWKDWEKELDWMALHGINFPLAMNGQEAVWQKVWRRHGLSNDEIRKFFTGPAFLPWHRMGNVNTHAGPLPQSFIDGQAALQVKILHRMRELGITPVEPAFSGFLPPAFAAKHPQLKTRKSSGWCGFDPTILLDPRDPMFTTLGKEFLDTYRSMYGVDGYYLADIFNEMTPQVSEATKFDDLRDTAQSVYRAITAGDPRGIWVTQGWLFFNEATFWGEKEIAAYLSGVPKDKIILLDLFSENTEVWRRSAAFRDRPYIWNMLHNFGGQTPLAGDLGQLAAKARAALDDPDHGKLLGMGLTMEGIHQNPPMYELMTDLMWRPNIDAGAWFKDYLAARWGSRAVANELAPEMQRVFYSGLGGRTFLYQHRPGLDGIDDPNPILAARPLAARMLSHGELWSNPLFRKDTLDVVKQVIGDGIDQALVNTYQELDAKQAPVDRDTFVSLLTGLDHALAAHPHYRLNEWVDEAKASAAPQDVALMARNARLQVTQWGGPVLSEYAAKEWSGLLSGYYLARWNFAFDALAGKVNLPKGGFDPAILQVEDRWIDHSRQHPVAILDDRAALQALVTRAEAVKQPVDHSDKGIAVGKPATDSGHTEGSGVPGLAVDGKVTGSWWAASPYPQWWQVDLGSATPINRIQVFTYYGDDRYYQYTVQISVDGTTWTTVADESANKKIATRKGMEHKFPAVPARYVRVNMLFNSANVGVHLREVRVFAP